ncbi:hypothetical protein GEMRC1_006238 [Eukaryota sp. GEM-RC1]
MTFNFATAHHELFCESCGTFLILSPTGALQCPCCLAVPPVQEGVLQTTVIESNLKPMLFTFDSPDNASSNRGAEIEETCPKCSHNRMSFTTVQLRSVDEGATVFYTCLKCNFRYSVNN